MTVTLGDGAFQYEALATWEQLPDGVSLRETPGVTVGSDDTVYVLCRNPKNPLVVLGADGSFQRSFGEGTFSERTHAILVAPDGSLLCADDGRHTITRWSPDGELLQTLGDPDNPAPAWDGKPFNRPTHAAISPRSGDIYVTDGYGNSCVHRFNADGKHLQTWGEPGIDAGQFIRPHNIAIDEDDLIYVADRECHRVQVFNADGSFVTMWNNIHRPDGMVLAPDGNIYIGELNEMGGLAGAPGLGHRVSVYNRDGEMLARFGDPEEGDGPGQWISPHGIAVDSRGDIYVGEVSFTTTGGARELRTLSKLRRTGN